VFKTLPTADHQAIEAFRFDAAHQRTRRVYRQAATIQFQIIDTSTLLCKTLGQQFATSDAAHDQHARCRRRNGLAQGRQREQGFAVITRRALTSTPPLQHRAVASPTVNQPGGGAMPALASCSSSRRAAGLLTTMIA
jgi:hypothetical protein